MRIPRRINDKAVRRIVIERHRHLLGKPPCRCVLQPLACGCPSDHCECPVEIAICSHAEDWNDDEQEAFDLGLAAFLLAVDPWNYGDPPQSPWPMTVADRETRITTMQWRVAAGLSPFREGDLDATHLKTGETITNGRNGAIQYQGIVSDQGGCPCPQTV